MFGLTIAREGLDDNHAATAAWAWVWQSAGLIGFVGLVVPHLARMMGARRHRQLLLASALIGGTLVVMSDILARTLRPPAELPLLRLDNVVLTAHTAGVDERSGVEMSHLAAKTIVALYRGEWPEGMVVNPEVKKTFKWKKRA